MKTKLAAVALAAVALAAVAVKVWAQRPAAPAAAAAPAGAPLTLIGSTRDTNVYFVDYQGHNCFIASTRGGSGVSITCAH